jgi:DNA-binding transcriptional MerR regulator
MVQVLTMASPRPKGRVAPPRRRSVRADSSLTTGDRPLKIGEAARLLGVEAYVLRFWETQFTFLRPRHASSSHRMYVQRDLDLLRLVKRLLHVEGYTIAGAKKHIREVGLERLCAAVGSGSSEPAERHEPPAPKTRDREVTRTLCDIREELQSLQKLLRD